MNQLNKTIRGIKRVMTVIWVVVLVNVLLLSVFAFHGISMTDFKNSTNQTIDTNRVLLAKRGSIVDRNGVVLAQTTETYNILCYLDPDRPNASDTPVYVVDKEDAASQLAAVLKISKTDILKYLKQDLSQTELGVKGRNLSLEIKNQIEALNITGIEFTKNYSRFYPNGSLAAHTIGFISEAENGLKIGKLGIEKNFNEELIGINGLENYQQDANGYRLPKTSYEIYPATNGENIYLTIDKGIQESLELALANVCKSVNSKEAWGGVIEVESGKVLGWAQYPTFDLNTLNIKNFNNIGIELPYEVGSTMKTFTYAATIDSNKSFNLNIKFNSNPFIVGEDKSGNIIRLSSKKNSIGTINNYANINFGTINFSTGFARSANSGIATLLEKYIKPSTFEDYLDKFGFFKKVNSNRFEDNPGTKIFTYSTEQITTGYGQGSTSTMLQLMQAYTGIMNEGKVVKPYFVEKITSSDHQKVTFQAKTEVVSVAISPTSAKQMVEAMKKNVDVSYGNARRYRLNNIDVVAKTGTSEVLSAGEYGNATIMSIMIGFPASDPKVICYYAVRTRSGYNIHDYAKYFKSVMRKTISALNLTNGPIGSEEPDNEPSIDDNILEIMPNLVNHSLTYSKNYLVNMKGELTTIGNGKSVIAQIPQANTNIIKGQKIFLLTDTKKVKMPNMFGWTRQEISCYFSLLQDFRVNIIGNGLVYQQSLAFGEAIHKDLEITLHLK